MTLDTSDEQGKLFIGGLSWETTKENLCEYFCRYGEVIDCVVMKHAETGRSRGFGFVTFKDPTCVQLVLSTGPHQLDGRTIDPKSCNSKNAQKGKREVKSSGFPKIFLGGLPPNINETVLRDFFSQYGKVSEVIIMYDQEKKKTRGFGFLSFENEEAVNKVVAEHYVNIGGKKVEVKRAEPREKSSYTKNDASTVQPSSVLQQHQQQSYHQQQPQQTPQLQQSQMGTPAVPWWPPQAGPLPPGIPPGAGPNGASIPFTNGVVVPNSYPGFVGGPGAQTAGYGPSWSCPPGYQGFQAWNPAYGYPQQAWPAQHGYAYGAAYPVSYPNYGTPTGPVAAPGAPLVQAPAPTQTAAAPPFAQTSGPLPPPPPPPIPSVTIATPLTQAAAPPPAGAPAPNAQENASYGPMRVYSYQRPGEATSGGPVTNASSFAGNIQGYHPYRRT